LPQRAWPQVHGAPIMTSATRSPETDAIAETGNWYPQRSGLRYSFVATVEVLDPKSGKQVISKTANLSSYGCHVRTDTPFRPGTMVKLTVRARSKTFRCEGKIIYSVSGEGMGLRFDNISADEQVTLNEWLLQASLEAREQKQKSVEPSGTGNRKIMFVVSVVVLVAIIAGIFLWLGVI
jgi:PilZ domain